jgi:hypothetical protein
VFWQSIIIKAEDASDLADSPKPEISRNVLEAVVMLFPLQLIDLVVFYALNNSQLNLMRVHFTIH